MNMSINNLVIESLGIGKHQHIDSKFFNNNQMKIGRSVEKEHTNDPKKADEIAKDHLAEIPDYYTRLNKMERKAKKEGKYNQPRRE